MLCVECGRREAKYDGLCEECFLKKVKFTTLPQHLTLTVCPHCHAVKFGGVWKDISIEDAIRKTVEKSLKITHELDSYELNIEYERGKKDFYCEVNIHIKYRDLEVVETHPLRFGINYQSCPRCDRYFGNYFEAILQVRNLRGDEEKSIVDYVHERIEHYSRKNRNMFLTREERKKEGWDFYLSDKRDAKKIARELVHKYGASLLESPQLAGRKDGRDVYRVTYSVRLPDYRIGDVIRVEDSYGVVRDIRGTFVKIIELKDFRERLVDSRRHKVTLSCKSKDLKDGLVIYSRGDYAQILSEDNRVIEIVCPIEMENGAKVRYIEIEGKMYIVP